jgi:nicotinamidase/pyrazinamidase
LQDFPNLSVIDLLPEDHIRGKRTLLASKARDMAKGIMVIMIKILQKIKRSNVMSKVLIVVDMLNDFVHKDGLLFFQAGADIIPMVKERIEAYMKTGDVIIFLCDAHAENDKEFEMFPAHAIKNTWGAGVAANLVAVLKDYENKLAMPKTRYSGFYNTGLGVELIKIKPDVVEVVGVCTSICVMDTVGGLANRDYKIVVPLNAVADFDEIAHHSALGRMGALYGAEIIQP